MEDVFTLVVITLLQLCQGQISQPEWFAANVINDQSYTPKPITEIFTSDSTSASKNPALFTQPTTMSTTRETSKAVPPSILQNGSIIQQIPTKSVPLPPMMSQIVQNTPNSELPNFVIIFDPNRQINPIQPPTMTSSPPVSNPNPNLQPSTMAPSPISKPMAAITQSTIATDMPLTTQPPTLATQTPIAQGNEQQLPSTVPPVWPLGSMLIYPIQIPNINTVFNSTNAPGMTLPNSTISPLPAQPLNRKPVLTVRVKAPRGSITNIRINPTTTVRPITTRRQRTTRNPNNYEACTKTCNGKKEPICSSPIGMYPINPDKLKGFASVCHMACNNSFRKEQVYEKVTDGRCGRLRTRIRPVDKNKLNREELNKAQYTIVHNGPETSFDFSPLRK